MDAQKILKKKKPKFRRTEYHRYKRLRSGWRHPRGHHNKMKARKKGKPKMPCVGYRTPVKIRGLVKGLKPKLVYNPKAVNDVDKTTEGIIIGRTVGQRKRAEIIKVADQLNIKVLNR